jgi:Beta-lactamase
MATGRKEGNEHGACQSAPGAGGEGVALRALREPIADLLADEFILPGLEPLRLVHEHDRLERHTRSLTKQFTAACILMLQERGKLKVDAPLKPTSRIFRKRGTLSRSSIY